MRRDCRFLPTHAALHGYTEYALSSSSTTKSSRAPLALGPAVRIRGDPRARSLQPTFHRRILLGRALRADQVLLSVLLINQSQIGDEEVQQRAPWVSGDHGSCVEAIEPHELGLVAGEVRVHNLQGRRLGRGDVLVELPGIIVDPLQTLLPALAATRVDRPPAEKLECFFLHPETLDFH